MLREQVEQEEEFITNKLMKRLEQLKNEKQTLANEVEQEEEYLINNLQKRLTKVHTEKVDLEKQLETEQEYIVNKLQKKVGLLGTRLCECCRSCMTASGRCTACTVLHSKLVCYTCLSPALLLGQGQA